MATASSLGTLGLIRRMSTARFREKCLLNASHAVDPAPPPPPPTPRRNCISPPPPGLCSLSWGFGREKQRRSPVSGPRREA
uniref:Uncharacterized protein n=1 Tax=Triticum urartu TaxID=4572 RepID=A0A8R7Q961_TRIUA